MGARYLAGGGGHLAAGHRPYRRWVPRHAARAIAGHLPGGGSQCRLRGDPLLGDHAAAGRDSRIGLRDQARTPIAAARLTSSMRRKEFPLIQHH